MKLLEIPSGIKIGDWSIQDEWNLDQVYIQTLSGETIVDTKNSNLNVYSSYQKERNYIQVLNETGSS